GNSTVVSPLTQPRFEAGTNSCTSGISTPISPAVPKPTKKRQKARKNQPGIKASGPGGKNRMPPAPAAFNARTINTLRRPVRVPPQSPEHRARPRAASRRHQDQRRLAIGQLPVLQDEGEDIADQEKIEEIQHIADIGGSDDLPLIRRQFGLPLQTLQHDQPPN